MGPEVVHMKRHYIPKTEYEKDFLTEFQKLSDTRPSWRVWQDFVTMAACMISNRVDWRFREEREKEYLNCAGEYSREELTSIAKLLATTTVALQDNPDQDFLGDLYMNLGMNDHWKGQYFTPWDMGVAMAAMVMRESDQEKLEETGYLSIYDPTCGSGCLLIAAGQACEERQKMENPKEHLFFVGQDIDRVVALMCYLQLSILGYAGYVIVGDSLTKPITGEGLIIIQAEGTEHWLTPAFFTEPWVSRVEHELAQLKQKEGHHGKQEAV